MPKNTYKIEIWRHHNIVNQKTFTNKKEAKKWLKNSGYIMMSDYGDCYIQIVINDRILEIGETNEWY